MSRLMKYLSGKRTKKLPKPLAPPSEITANIAVGSPGFRAEDVYPEALAGNNPGPSRIVPDQTGGRVQGHPEAEIPAIAVAIGDIEPGDQLTSENAGQLDESGRTSVDGDSSGSGSQIESAEETGVPKIVRRFGGANMATEKLGPLRAVLRAIRAVYGDREGAVAVRNKIEVLLSRIYSLETCFDSPPGDVVDLKRRRELIDKLKLIDDHLRSLSEKLRSQQPTDHVQDDGGFQLLEDLEESILDYKAAQRRAAYDRELKLIDTAEAVVFNNFRHAIGAGHHSGDRNSCLKGTRTAVLSEIELWIRDFEKPPVYWLNGLAGTGKSTIAQTIAERAFADGLLGASFFCSRDFEDRSRLHFILPTLAVQLARVYPQFRSILVSLVQSDPGISHESLYNQMSRLIAQPLMDSAISTVIVIDALDECMDDEPASAILSILGKFVAGLPRVKFIVTGRPDPHIREGFRLPLLVEATNMFVLHQVDPRQVDNDIHRFFRHNFLELTRRRPGLDDWPTEEQLNLLCYRSAGLFAYAVATVKFIDHRSNHPRNQLDRLLRSPERTAFEGKTKFRANTSLYSLYTSILESAFGDNDPSNDPKIRSVLGAVVLATNPLSPFAIAEILNLSTEDVLPILLSVHSLLVLQEDIDHPVRPFHKSFCDFIVDPTGCTNSRFLLRPLDQHEELLIGCLELVNRRLEHNICRLPDAVANSEVDDLRERTRRYIDEGLEYACKSWHKHPIGATSAHPLPARITPVLLHFLEKKFLFWLEALSVLGCVRTAVEALEATTKWLDSSTLEVVRDYSRFVITFFEVISTSATHIYHSALLLSPQTSIIRRLYQQYDRPLARVVRGLPNSWGPIITTAYRDDFGGGATWSPCSRFIALAKSGIIEVLDAVTLQRLGAFDSPPDSRAQRLSFSPDSRLITQSSAKNINTWDLQTGGLASTIIPPQLHESVTNFLSTHSLDGKLVAVANEETFDSEAFITTYNLLPDTHPPVRCVPEGRIIPPIWTHGECLQFATVEQGSITIWEAGFNLVHPPAKAKTLPAPPEAVDGGALLFLPVLFRLAFVLRDTIFVWDATASRFLLKSRLKPASDLVRAPESLHFPHRSTFSSNGQRFAHMDTTGDLYVWKESSPGYVLHQKLTFDTPIECAGPLLSPNGESIIIHTRQEIHLLSTKDEIHSESTYSGQNRFILEFSPDRMSAAFAQMWENTVTILDLQSGEARFSIDAGMEIECVGVNEKMVVVVGEGKIVTWNLLTGNQALSAHMNISNSVRTTMLHHSPLFFNLREFVHTSISPDLTRIVAAGGCTKLSSAGVETYDASTGRCLAGATSITTSCRLTPRFAAGGCEVWALDDYSSVEGWKIVGNREYTDTELVPLEPGSCPPGVFPWQSRSGYEVTGDGWVRGPSKKRLLWLPPHWRSEEGSRTWSERFVGLRHGGLSEVVILEFFE